MIYDTLSNLELNIKMMLDIALLCDGYYKTITSGQIIRSVDASKLILDISAQNDLGGISGCQVWQSPVQNWVYESGITLNQVPFISGLTPPIVSSGVYVNGVFYSQSGGVSGNQFFIDYINGRVVFVGTGIPINSNVQANYSYKLWRTDWQDAANGQLCVEDYAELSLKDNPYGTAWLYPSGDERSHTFPCIYIDIMYNTDFRPLELGNRSQIERVDIHLDVFALSRWERNAVLQLLKNRLGLSSYVIDFNYAPFPLSGLVNTLSPEYIPFQTLVTNPKYNGQNVVSWTYDILDGAIRRLPNDGPFMRGEAIFNAEIYNISPNGRTGGVVIL